jgi:hypothetical protein
MLQTKRWLSSGSGKFDNNAKVLSGARGHRRWQSVAEGNRVGAAKTEGVIGHSQPASTMLAWTEAGRMLFLLSFNTMDYELLIARRTSEDAGSQGYRMRTRRPSIIQ